jgi:signal transduction histidine kinase
LYDFYLLCLLQESLSNVARHAEADSVGLSLSMAPDKVTLTVADDGRGFEPDAVSPNSLGMASMQQRLSEINGTLTIESTPEAGAKIVAKVQLSP